MSKTLRRQLMREDPHCFVCGVELIRKYRFPKGQRPPDNAVSLLKEEQKLICHRCADIRNANMMAKG